MVAWWPDDQRHQAHWTLDGLTGAAHRLGIRVERSQVRPVLLGDPTSPQRTRVVALSTHPPKGATVVCADELGPVTRAPSRPHRAGRPMGTGSRHPWSTAVARSGCGVRRAAVGDGQERTLTAPRATPPAGSGCCRRSSGPTRPGSSRWSATTCPATTAGRCGRGWPTTPHPAGVHPQTGVLAAPAGGLVAAVSPCGALAGRSLPTPVSSSTPRGWPPASSTGALGRGVGPSAPPTRKLRRKFVYRL